MTQREKYEAWKAKRQQEGGPSSVSKEEYDAFRKKYTDWKVRTGKVDIASVRSEVDSRVGTWMKNNRNYTSNYNSRFGTRTSTYGNKYLKDTYSQYRTAAEQKQNFDIEANSIMDLLDQYRDYLDTDWADSVRSTLGSARANQNKIMQRYIADAKYWTRFGDEEQYRLYQTSDQAKRENETGVLYRSTNLDYESYARANEQQKKLTFDTAAGEKEISDLNSILSVYGQLDSEIIKLKRFGGDTPEIQKQMQKYTSRIEDLRTRYGTVEEIQNSINQKNQFLGEAKRIQASHRKAETAANDSRFAELGAVNTATKDAKYRYINDEKYRQEYRDLLTRGGGFVYDNFAEAGLDMLSDHEKKIYNYYYATEGAESADEYLGGIRESLNNRRAQSIYKDLECHTALEMAFGVEAGIDQFQSGMKSLIHNQDGEYLPASAKQMASQMVREDLKDDGFKTPDWMGGASLGQIGYDAITTTANMAPSILASTVANYLLPGSGAVVGNVLLGASAVGGAYQEALNQGYEKKQAGAYATMVGASEVGLNYLLGGISKLGGKVTGGALQKLLSNVDNVIFRTAGELGGNMLSEGLEEGLQEVMTTWFKNIYLNQNNAINGTDVLYSSLLGALTAGVFEGTSVVGNAASTHAQGRQLITSGAGESLVNLGKTFDLGSAARELADKVNITTDAYTLGRLLREVDAGLSDQNKADIAKSLMSKGMDAQTAIKNAKIMEYVIEGGEVSNLQMEMIQKNTVLADTMREVMNGNSSVNQRNAGYSGVMDALDPSRTNPAEAGGTIPETEGNLPTEQAIAAEAVYEPETLGAGTYEDGKTYHKSTGNVVTPRKVTSIKDGKVTLETEDNQTVNAEDVEFGDEGYDLVFRSITSAENMTPTAANTILQVYEKTGKNISAGVYAMGAAQAYRHGYHGMNRADLNYATTVASNLAPAQVDMIYAAGRQAAADNARSAQMAARNTSAVKSSGKVHFEGNAKVLTDIQRTSLSALEKVAEVTGLEFHIFESKVDSSGRRVGANGYYKNNAVYIDLHAGTNGGGTMLFTASHELTHHIKKWSPEKFKTLADFLMTEYGKKNVSVDELVAKQIQKAKNNGRTLTYDEAFEEIIADSMETMLSDGDVMEKLTRLKQQDKSLWQKVKDFIRDLAAKIRSVYEGLTADTVEGRYVAEMKDAIEKLQDLFAEGIADATENFQAAMERGGEQKNTAGDGGEKYSIRVTTDGRFVAVVESDILKDIDTSSWNQEKKRKAQAAAVEALKQFTDGIVVKGITRLVNRTSRREYTRSKDTARLFRTNTEIFADKMRAADVADDIVVAATDWNRDGGLSHPRSDDFVDFDHGKTLIMSGSAQYSAEVVVGITSDGKAVFYDVVDMMPTHFEIKNAEPHSTATTNESIGDMIGGSADLNVAQKNIEVNKKFSMREPVEYTKNLIALHNLTEDKLEKALKLGGFPMPSIAITKADIPHTNFGDITLVFGSEVIDPKQSKKNVVYSADAWTPTFPRIEYEADDKVSSRVHSRLSSLSKQVDEYFRRDLGRVTYDMEDILNRYDGEEGLIQYALDNYGLKAAYLEERGEHIQPETRQEEVTVGISPEMEDKYLQILEVLDIYAPEQVSGLVLKDVRDKHGKELEEIYPGVTKSALRLGRVLNRIRAYLSGVGMGAEYKTVTDAAATNAAVDSKLDAGEYEAWVRELFRNVEKSRGVRNNKDRFTPSGNRRTFKQTHLPATLENIVKAMSTQNGGSTKNVSGFNGIKTLRAGTAKRFRSIAEMHEYEGRLQNLTEDQLSEIQDQLGSRLYDIIKAIDDEGAQLGGSNSLIRYDYIGGTLTEIAEGGRYNVSEIQKTFAEYGKELSDELAAQVKELLFDVTQMPVNLFEAKPERAVLFDEIKAAILPNSTKKEVIDGLRGRGVPVQIYKAGDNNMRLNLVNSMTEVKFSDRDTESVSNRTLLANALESALQTPEERKKLAEYRERVATVEDAQKRLDTLNGLIREASFAPGKRDTQKIAEMRKNAEGLAGTIDRIDRQILNLEATAPLKALLEREKKKAYKKAEQKGKAALKELRATERARQTAITKQYQESRAKGIESRKKTAMRAKVKGVVQELNQYLLRGTKDKHVPIELQKAVAEALEAVNMDTVGAEERIARLQAEMANAKTPEQIQEIAKKISNVQGQGDRMADKLKSLRDAYNDFIHSDDPLIANSHDEVIAAKLEDVIHNVGETSLRDMSLSQLEDVYDMYRMILTTVRNANKAFKSAKNQSIAEMGTEVIDQVKKVGGEKKMGVAFLEGIKKFGWNNLKPVYAFEAIGSETFTQLFKNVRSGEDTWARDVADAREFYLEKARKYQYDSWDFKKNYSFESTSGMRFQLNLEQIMSLYAYSKREQAADHLRFGGIVFDRTTEVTMKTKLGIPVKFNPTEATAYNISDNTLMDIVTTLNADQKAFVDEMQEYLSTTMGNKGNEVSLEMYGVKLFKEKNYFPLKSSEDWMEKAKEQNEQVSKIKNSGFSKETTPHAKNPVVLTPFMNVWADHVNDMSMYHAFVLPMEDFYRVYNFKIPVSETNALKGVKPAIENAYGEGAADYIDQLLKDLNGGARSDPRETLAKSMMSKFKKAAVMSSLSVVFQQPTSIVRAMALVDAKHFGIAPIGRGIIRVATGKKHREIWGEIKKYAPVATIKEMGYFDTNTGKSTRDYLTAKERKGIGKKIGAFFFDGDYRDEFFSKLPSVADELAWCAIWEAVQKETIEKYPGFMTKNPDAFKQLVGARFTEVVTKTQVYDSVLARSAHMRSKGGMMNMWTSFMAEPTTSINMLHNALLQGNRGNKKQMAKTIAAVYGSVFFNAIVASLVYAARDDDEDETLGEKYFSRLTTELLDGVNLLTYIPVLKDIWSIAQGFDIERADMSLVADLINSLQKCTKIVATDTDDMDEEELSEHQKKTADALWSVVDNIASLAGLPLKNIRREYNGLRNFIHTMTLDLSGRETSLGSLIDNILDDVKASTPIWGWLPGESKGDKLYEAIASGDDVYAERLRNGYKSEDAADIAIRKALRDNDPRVRAAAEALNGGNHKEYLRIFNEIAAENHFSQSDISKAIKAEAEKLLPDKEDDAGSESITGKFTVENYVDELAHGGALADTIKADIIDTAIHNGKTKKEAVEGFATSVKTQIGKRYKDGEITAAQVYDMLGDYLDMSDDDIADILGKWKCKVDTGIEYDDIKDEFLAGNVTESEAVKYRIKYGDQESEEAEATVQKWICEKNTGIAYDDLRDAFANGDISAEEAVNMHVTYGGYSEEDAVLKVKVYQWQLEGYEIDANQTDVIKRYEEHCVPANISKGDFYSVWKYKSTAGRKDANGDTVAYSVVKDVMPYINSLPLTAEQKTALALCWWSPKTVRIYKLW
ncbi:MAG: hypothetical protein IKJ99_04820 [Oscillospiraceae bacterium]|nr:hypothetical protein [Oscillospiraceae bacterium]